MKQKIALWLSAALLISLAIVCTPIAYAVGDGVDADGSEIQITDQPDKLILQLGPQWVGVEFELKTDVGVFPVPVVVDASGILKMDLGGSKTYILSCLTSPVNVPRPEFELETTTRPLSIVSDDAPASETARNAGIPAWHLILFLLGLAAAVGGLFAIKYFKRRLGSYSYDEDDYE